MCVCGGVTKMVAQRGKKNSELCNDQPFENQSLLHLFLIGIKKKKSKLEGISEGRKDRRKLHFLPKISTGPTGC